jgi:adenylate cyclase
VLSEAKRLGSVRLGGFVYHIGQDKLTDALGQVVVLRAQSAHVLRFLAENSGSVVTKNALIAEVWPKVNVTDDSLTQCIADIRRSIGDSKRTILQTVPKVGYALRPTQQTSYDFRPDGGHGPIEASDSTQVHIVCDTLPQTRHPLTGADRKWLKEKLDNALLSCPGGRVIGTDAASALLEFPNALSALQYAQTVKSSEADAAATGPQSGNSRFLRIALDLSSRNGAGNSGTDESLLRVRTAALLNFANAGQIVVSVDVRDVALGDLDFEFEDLGERHDTGTGLAIRAFRPHPRNASWHFLPELSEDDLLPTIAVIPFVARSRTDENVILGDIIAEDIIACLSRSAEINVTSRLSTGAFKSRNVGLSVIGNTLKADFVLSGSFAGDQEKVVLTLEFAEVRSNKVLWSDQIEISVASLLHEIDTVNEIALRIRRAILLREVRRARHTPLPTLKSYTLLLGAIGLMHRLQPADFETAGELLKSLIERTPNQPLPLSWMARWHVLRVQQGWSGAPQEEGEMALTLCRRALEFDPENVIALISEGLVLTNLLHRLEEAEERYDMALELNPNDANGRLLRGALYAFKGLGDKAKRDAERALHLSPIDPHRFFFLSLAAGANLAAGNYERALTLADASLRLNRSHTSTLRVKTVAHWRLEQLEDARQTAQDLLKLQPDFRVNDWLKKSPSADYSIGLSFAKAFREVGIPD